MQRKTKTPTLAWHIRTDIDIGTVKILQPLQSTLHSGRWHKNAQKQF